MLKRILMLIVMLGLFISSYAQTPQSFKYQAVARDSFGFIMENTAVTIRVTILNGSSTGTPVFQETHNLTTNNFGLFTLNVGTINTIDFANINWGAGAKYMRIEMDPAGGTNYLIMGNEQLVSVPYALYAETSGSGGGLDEDIDSTNELNLNASLVGTDLEITDAGGTLTVDLSSLLGGGVDGDTDSTNELQTLSISGNMLSLSDGGTVALPSGSGGTLDDAYDFGGPGAGRTITADAGEVEITTSTPNGIALRTTQTNSGAAIVATNSFATSQYSTIQATTNSNSTLVAALTGSTTGEAWALAGQVQAAATAAAAVYGSNLRTTGGSGVSGEGFNGTAGEANNTLGFGAFGENIQRANGVRTGYTNLAPGVNGIGFMGVLGQTDINDGAGVLWVNIATLRDGTYDNAGVEGQGVYGVVGTSNTPGVGAGVASYDDIVGLGNLLMLGTKSFRIDHPLDPENKYLKHFCLESNEVLNIYRGNVILDQNGDATIELPEYFEAVNANYSYNLTPVGASAPALYVDNEIEHNTFSIAGGTPGLKVSWQVIAARNDVYVKNHPASLEVEPDKPDAYRGKYLYPEGYGQSEDKAIMRRSPMEQLVDANEKTEQMPLNLQEGQKTDNKK